jgi:hypothetical protein
MSAARWVERATRILIFGGLLTGGLGGAALERHELIGWSLLSLAVVAVVAGVVLIWVRARMTDES